MKTLITLIYLVIVGLVSISAMVYGWGLTPKSWGWILLPFAVMIGPVMAQAMTKD